MKGVSLMIVFGFFRCDTWLQIFQNDSKICEPEVTLTPLFKKICKPWALHYEQSFFLIRRTKGVRHENDHSQD